MRSFFVCLALIASISVCAQSTSVVIDSLRQSLSVQPNDAQRLATLNQLATIYLRVSGDSTRKYGQQALQLAIETQNSRAQGDACKSLGTLATNEGKLAQARESYLAALDAFTQADYPIGQGQCYNNLGMLANRQGDFESALRYTQQSLEIKTRIGDSAGIANGYNALAAIHEAQQNNDLAIEYYRKTVAMQEKVGSDLRIADAYNNLGRMLFVVGDDNALGWMLKGIQLRRKTQDKKGLASSYRNVAEVYAIRMRNHEKALEFSEHAIGYYRELHDAVPLAECLLFQGNLHKAKGQYTTAILLYRESIAITEPIQSYAILILGEKSVGETLLLTKQYREAEAALEKALQHITAQNAPNIAQQINEVAALLISIGEATNDRQLIQQYTPIISKN